MTEEKHASEHFFKGVCICPCRKCTAHTKGGQTFCTCKDCPRDPCGMKVKSA